MVHDASFLLVRNLPKGMSAVCDFLMTNVTSHLQLDWPLFLFLFFEASTALQSFGTYQTFFYVKVPY